MITTCSQEGRCNLIVVLHSLQKTYTIGTRGKDILFCLSYKYTQGIGYEYLYGRDIDRLGLFKWVKGKRWQYVEVPEEIEEAFPEVKAIRDLIRNV